jgi:hypothetical protein
MIKNSEGRSTSGAAGNGTASSEKRRQAGKQRGSGDGRGEQRGRGDGRASKPTGADAAGYDGPGREPQQSK